MLGASRACIIRPRFPRSGPAGSAGTRCTHRSQSRAAGFAGDRAFRTRGSRYRVAVDQARRDGLHPKIFGRPQAAVARAQVSGIRCNHRTRVRHRRRAARVACRKCARGERARLRPESPPSASVAVAGARTAEQKHRAPARNCGGYCAWLRQRLARGVPGDQPHAACARSRAARH